MSQHRERFSRPAHIIYQQEDKRGEYEVVSVFYNLVEAKKQVKRLKESFPSDNFKIMYQRFDRFSHRYVRA